MPAPVEVNGEDLGFGAPSRAAPGEVSGEAIGIMPDESSTEIFSNIPMPPTSIVLREPSEEDVSSIPGDSTRQIPAGMLDKYLERAGQNAFSGPVNEARKTLAVARDLGAPPDAVKAAGDQLDQIETQNSRDKLSWKLQQLPRIAQWMAQGTQYAVAIQSEVDQWGTLDYLFGRYQTRADRGQDVASIINQGGPDVDRKLAALHKSDEEDAPGWVLAAGRAGYSTATSIQTNLQALYGNSPKSVQQIQGERDIASAPVPGDNKLVQKQINEVASMTPLMAAATISPAAAFGLMYEETSGRAYEDLRLSGYEHEEAAEFANTIGFATAAVGASMGPLLKFNFLPKATIGLVAGLPNSVLTSMMKSPTVWRGLTDLGRNFFATTAMNIAMATTEAGLKEGLDSIKENRLYDNSRVVSAGLQAADSWASMLALSVVPAYKGHLERRDNFKAATTYTAEETTRAKFQQAVYDNYEEKGRALRSLHEASQLTAAVDAIKKSKFMASNPEDARDLIQSLVAPRASQTVYIDPAILKKMPQDDLTKLGSPDQSLPGNVPVNITDFLMHPQAEALLPHTAGGPDLMTLKEATGVDLTKPVNPGGADVPDEALDQWLAEEKARQKAARDNPVRIPSSAELHTATQGAFGRRPAPELAPEPKTPQNAPQGPSTARELRAWADDAVLRRPSGELASTGEAFENQARRATEQAFLAQQQATEHAAAQRMDQVKALGDAAQAAKHAASVSKALGDATQRAVDEVTQIGKNIAALASDEPGPNKLSPREIAYAAGADYGQAQDAILEMLGAAKKHGYAAPDLSDIYDRLMREQKFSDAGFEGFDLKQLNRLLRNQQEIGNLSLGELREVNKALTAIAQGADAENTVRINGIRVAKQIMRDGIAEHLKSIPSVPDKYSPTLKGLDKLGAKTAGIRAEIKQPHTLLFKLGPVGDSLWFDGFIPGVVREERMWNDLETQVKQIHDALPEALRASGQDLITMPDGKVVTRSAAWHLALHLGTAGADLKISQGMGLKTPGDLHSWLHENLGRTPADAHALMHGLIEPHWKLFDQLWGEYEQHFKERGIAPPEKLEAQPLTVHGKEYSGGYGGRLQWLDLKDPKAVVNPGSLEALLGPDAAGPSTQNRHLNERDPNFRGIPVLDWGGVQESMQKEVHDIALRPFVEDAHKVFSDGEIRKLLADKMGKDALNQIFDPNGSSSFLHTVARGSVADVHSARGWTQAVVKLQGIAAYSAFSLNFRVMAGQISHIGAAAFGLGIAPDHVVIGVRASMNPDRRAWAHANSQILPLRYNDFEKRAVEMNREMTGVRGTGDDWLAGKLGPTLNAPREAADHLNWAAWREMDGFLSHAIWEMGYAKAIGTGRDMDVAMGKFTPATHQDAVRQADKAVTMMMPAQDIYDQSAFVRDRSVMGFGYMVRNFPNTLANVAAMNWWNARVDGRVMSKAGAAARYVGMVMAAEIIGKGFIMQGGPKDSDDPATWVGEHAVSSLLYPTMLSDPGMALYHAAQGDRARATRDLGHMTPAAISVIGTAMQDVAQLYQVGNNERANAAAAQLMGLVLKTSIPSKLNDFRNAAVNSDSPQDALKKGLGYHQ